MDDDDVNSNEEDSEYSFTLFSDITQNILAMRENLNEKVSEALKEELKAEKNSENSDCADEDDTPLLVRANKLKEINASLQSIVKRTRSNRGCCKRRQIEDTTVTIKDKAIETTTLVVEDDDVEFIKSVEKDESSILDCSVDEIVIEEDNKLVSVKINWMSLRVHRFEIRKFQKFTSIFEQLAEKEKVPKEKILLILRDEVFISEDDTPDSLKLSVADIIEGGITKETFNKTIAKKQIVVIDPSMLEFKCVLKDQKKPLQIHIKKTDTMHWLMVKTSEQLDIPLENLKFMFEGETLESSFSPADLDMEGGEVIHVHIKG